jgi:hypothetical protein
VSQCNGNIPFGVNRWKEFSGSMARPISSSSSPATSTSTDANENTKDTTPAATSSKDTGATASQDKDMMKSLIEDVKFLQKKDVVDYGLLVGQQKFTKEQL